MIAVWLVLFVFSAALAALAVFDNQWPSAGARVFGLVFGVGLMAVFAFMALRAM